jgi:hypothetical protein
VFLPVAVVVNHACGIVVLASLGPSGWTDWLELAVGAACCLCAGWAAAAAWSRTYWLDGLERRAVAWRRIVEAFLGWAEGTPMPPDALSRLRARLLEVLSKPKE